MPWMKGGRDQGVRFKWLFRKAGEGKAEYRAIRMKSATKLTSLQILPSYSGYQVRTVKSFTAERLSSMKAFHILKSFAPF